MDCPVTLAKAGAMTKAVFSNSLIKKMMMKTLKLVLIGWGLFLLAAHSAYAAGNVEVQPYFESGEGVNDAIGFRYRFYVVENESRDSLKAIRGVSRFKGNGSQDYLIETGVYSSGIDYSNYSCSDSQNFSGQTNPAEASLRIGLPYSTKSSLPGVKTNNPAIFPRVTYETETKGQARAELVSQLNLNGKQGMVEISKGEAVTDKSGWLCEKDLEDIDYTQWNITAGIDSEDRRMALALPKEAALSLASGALLSLQGESLHSAGAFKVYYWGIEVKRSSGKWEGLDKWMVTNYDGSLTDYGIRKVKYNNGFAIEISNDGSQGEFFKEGEIFSLSAPEDSAPPSGSLSINSGVEYTNTKNLTLNLSAQDDTGVTGYYISEEPSVPAKDKDGWVSLSPITGYNASITYSLKDEEKTPAMITLYAWYKDAVGNISEMASDSISLDMTAPSLSVTGPTTASVFNTKEAFLTLSGTASDDASGVEKITYTNSQGAQGTAAGTTKWSIPGIQLSKGENIFTLTAYDKLNNSAHLSFTANCEIIEPPGIPVFSQKYDGKAVTSGSLSWSWGPAESGSPAEEYWISPSWLPNGFSTKEASYSLTKKLSKGTYQISVMAKNSAGISKKARDIVVIIEETSSKETPNQTKDKTSQAQTTDKSETNASQSSKSDTTISKEESKTKSKTESESKSGSKSDTASSQETYSAPSGFLTIEDGQPYINSKRIKLNLSASDDSGITAYYLSNSSDTPSVSADGWVTIDKVSLLDRDIDYELTADAGRKDIYAWFKNSSGRLSSGHSESITLDTTDPEIESNDYEVTSSGTAVLSVKADDKDSGIKSLKWKKGAAQGTAIYQESSDSWSIEGVTLSEGDNEVAITAEDEAGNTAQKNITITYSPEEKEIREAISEKVDFIKSALDRKDSAINDYLDDNWEKFLEYNGYIYAALRGIKANKWENSAPLTDKEREYIFENLSEIIKNTSFLKEAGETVDLDKNKTDNEDNYLPAAIRELLYINFMSVYNKKDDFLTYKEEIAETLGLSKDKGNIVSRIFYDFDALFVMDIEEYEQDLVENHIYRLLEEIPYRRLYSQPLIITAPIYATAGFLEEGPEMLTGRINIEDDLNIKDAFYQINRNIWSNIKAEEDGKKKKNAYTLIQRAGLKQNNYLRDYSKEKCDQCGTSALFTGIDSNNNYCFKLNEDINLESEAINSCGLLQDDGEKNYCINLGSLSSEQNNGCSEACDSCFIFYVAMPDEFFPHLSLSWLNTADALSQARELLGDEESSSRYYEPLNQFLFFADIYSQGGTKIKIYELDEKNIKETSDDVLKARNADIERDADNRIKSITINTIKYKFELDDEGYAIDCQKETLEGDSTDYKPLVYTLGVTEKTHNSAKLRGKVNANGLSTQVKFEYGTSSGSYDYETTVEKKITGSDDMIVTIAVSGLSAGTTYYYRLSAENSNGTSYAEEETFTTEDDPSAKEK